MNIINKKSEAGFTQLLKLNTGFTMMELLAAIAVFSIMLGITMMSFNQGENRDQLRLAGDKLASDFRKMQTASLAGLISGEIDAGGGFGLYLSMGQNNSYILFRDDGVNNNYEDGVDTVLNTIILPAGITINSLTANPLSIVFKPPKPTIYLNGAQALNDLTVILYSDNIADQQLAVSLNRITGRILAELQTKP